MELPMLILDQALKLFNLKNGQAQKKGKGNNSIMLHCVNKNMCQHPKVWISITSHVQDPTPPNINMHICLK